MKTVTVILGPKGSGKTKLALRLMKHPGILLEEVNSVERVKEAIKHSEEKYSPPYIITSNVIKAAELSDIEGIDVFTLSL